MSKVIIRPYIFADDTFDVPLKTFCDYAGRKEMNFSIGDGGIYLKLRSTLGNEACEIDVTKSGVYVYASTQKGMHNAMAILLSNLEVKDGLVLLDSSCKGENPDMPYRGLMVDLARQKHPVSYIYEYIDVCYINRATHLQLHFTDNESFTLPISAFPKLSTQGRTYTREEIAGICDYAKSRGIILVPEVDVPGHTIQFCEKYPEIFGTTKILPADEKVYDAVKTIFAEVVDMFPDSPLIHIGGDEVDVENWENCIPTQEYMKKNGIESYQEMYAQYIHILIEMVLELGRTPVVWEGFAKEYNDRISKDVIVMCFEYLYQTAVDLAKSGFTIINASWVPLYIITGMKRFDRAPEEILDWDPWTWRNWWQKSLAYPGPVTIDKDTSNVIGGQLCAWGDGLKDMENWETGLDEELNNIKEKLPLLCKKLINIS